VRFGGRELARPSAIAAAHTRAARGAARDPGPRKDRPLPCGVSLECAV